MQAPLLNPSVVSEWFQKRYPSPTPAQSEAWPRIQAGHSALIVSPTGTGKTFAGLLSVLNELALLHEAGQLRNTIYAIYISPLRALSYDLEKNLNYPLREIYGANPPIRVGLRTGDTTPEERVKQFKTPPHLLLTTPESLSLLLTQEKWAPLLQTVRWVVIDEIHALAENKRGSHLSLSLERLEHLRGSDAAPLQRIGLSATVAPLDRVAQFLAGTGRTCEIIDVSAVKAYDIRVYSPLGKNPYPPSGYTGQRLIRELAELVDRHRTTLIFTNTRSGAEAATYWLREELPELDDQIECHHASLERDVRQEVEDRLKNGELRAVVCSTSLELGIDIGSIDLVVMLSTPKGVSKALQRTGRSGHNINSISRGLLMATNINDLVECCATVLLARSRQLDFVRIPEAPLDVLAQHLVSMGCLQSWTRAEALNLVRRAYPFRALSEADYNEVLDYLAGGGKSLRRQYSEVFGKIILDDESFVTKAGPVRRDLLQNLGVIPSEGVVRIQLKSRTLGTVEESFARQLKVGDVFMIGGRPVRLERIGVMECFVSRADNVLPTVPRWNANKMPLSSRVAREINAFRTEARERLAAGEGGDTVAHWIAERLDCGLTNARIIHRMHAAQYRLSDIPTADFLLVEEFLDSGEEIPALQLEDRSRRRRKPKWVAQPARHYFFHCLVGRGANEALSRVVGLRLSRLRGGNAIATADDSGFVLTVTPQQHFTGEELRAMLSAEAFADDLRHSIQRSELLKYHFRSAAQTGMMVYRNFFGEQKSVRKVQWSSEVIFNVLAQYEPDHILLREAHRDTVHTYIDIAGALQFLAEMERRPVRLKKIDRVPPLSFAMFATKIKEALLVEDPRETMERLYHLWWTKIENA